MKTTLVAERAALVRLFPKVQEVLCSLGLPSPTPCLSLNFQEIHHQDPSLYPSDRVKYNPFPRPLTRVITLLPSRVHTTLRSNRASDHWVVLLPPKIDSPEWRQLLVDLVPLVPNITLKFHAIQDRSDTLGNKLQGPTLVTPKHVDLDIPGVRVVQSSSHVHEDLEEAVLLHRGTNQPALVKSSGDVVGDWIRARDLGVSAIRLV